MRLIVFLAAAFIAPPVVSHDGEDHGAEAEGVASVAEMPAGRYEVEPTHAYITVQYSHLGFSNPTLVFSPFDGYLELDPEDPQKSRVVITVDAASVESHVPTLNDHLRGSDFFDVANFPTISFESTAAIQTADVEGKLAGSLTIKGKTLPVTLDVTLNKAGKNPISGLDTIGISASTMIARSTYGMDAYAPAVSDAVHVRFEVEFAREP